MSQLLLWPTVTYFHPVGNTSAVCLTDNIAPEDKVDVLLLACGDPRHILYTVYVNETNPLTRLRAIDITCCDVDVAILARNALLFTFLADDGVLDKLDHLWNLFYHMFVDQTSLFILFEHCRKLIALAESVETWRAGPYGYFLSTCDAATLAGLRRVWITYLDTATFSPKQSEQFRQRILDGMKAMSQVTASQGTTIRSANRSAGPLSPFTPEAVSRQFSTYWSSGVTDDALQGQARSQKRPLSANPTFAYSINGDKFSVHFATDPLSGFHLAEAFASGKFTDLHEFIPPHGLVCVAKTQFLRWCVSMNRRLKDNSPSSPTFVVRMFAGDPLMFCHALKYCEVMQALVTPYNIAAWSLSTITLDDHRYGRNAVLPAPVSFNVIDTSHIVDHAGMVNVLVVAAPLLLRTPSATLYTEVLLNTAEDPSQAILEYVCGDLATMTLLLGIIPSTLLSQFTTRSSVHETFTVKGGARQYLERFPWKLIGFGGDHFDNTPHYLCFKPENLAAFLFRVYLRMFSEEDFASNFQSLLLSPQKLHTMPILHYNRRSFALFVHFAKTRVQTDWCRTMEIFEDLILGDEQLTTGRHAYQELCCHLHLLGVHTYKWMSVPALQRDLLEKPAGATSLFGDWTWSSIPQVVAVVLVVPRDTIAGLEPDFVDVGMPALQCDMHNGPRPGQIWFAVTSATFGSLYVSGTGEHRRGVVVEARGEDSDALAMQPPWRSTKPLIITFSAAVSSILEFARSPRATVGLVLRPNVQVAGKFALRLGFDLTVFRAEMTNVERVFFLARRPVVSTHPGRATNTRAEADNIVASHWQAHTREGDHEARTDVHVQMEHASSVAQSFSVRINVTDPGAQEVLADPQMIPTVNSCSGSKTSLDSCVRIGPHSFPIQFPLPIDIVSARLRIARRSSYIEVVAPLAPFRIRPEHDIANRFVPLSLGPEKDAMPMLWNVHRVNLDGCPPFKLASSMPNWFDLHVTLMLSELEKEQIEGSNSTFISTSPLDTLSCLKRTLCILLRSAAGMTLEGGAPKKLFALHDASLGGSYLFIVPANIRLDVGSHTVVADAFVALATPLVHAALTFAAREDANDHGLQGVPMECITTDADETTAWYYLVPRLTERCRTYPHKANCAYRSRLQKPQKTNDGGRGAWEGESPLCNCGASVGTEILGRAYEVVAPYLTRAAFGPLFSVPYLKGAEEPRGIRVGPGPAMERLWRAPPGKAPESSGKMDVGDDCRSCGKEAGLACSRCKRARYCSKECQLADWKGHKKHCKGVQA